MGFADETISVICDWGLGGKPEVLVVSGDESRDGPGFLDLGAQAHLRLSWVLGPVSEVATDIFPKWASNEDTSTLPFANCLSFLTGSVSLNWVTRFF